MLRQLRDGNVLLNLNAQRRRGLHDHAVDDRRGARHAELQRRRRHDPQLQALLECDEAVAVAYLDNVKLQFDVQQPGAGARRARAAR